MPATYLLKEERDRQFALAAVYRAPIGMAVVIDKPKRTTEQERRLRSMIKAIMDAKCTWAGTEWDSDEWREILVSAWLTSKRKESGRMIQGIEGEPVVVGRRRGSQLNTEEFGELMDMTLAWLTQNGAHWEEREEPPVPDGYYR